MPSQVRILAARPHRLFPPLAEELGELHRNEESAILLVPEILTLETERELFRRLKIQGSFFIDVLSPSRFYERVLERGGRDQREPLNAAGRRMAVSLALERLEDRLDYYGSLSLRTGFVEKAAALIADLKRGGMDPAMLKEYAEGTPPGISREKLLDLALIYAQYEEVLKGRFSDSEDQLRYVAGRLEDSGYLEGKHLYVYGFDALPDQLMRMLTAAAPLCKSLSVALLWENEDAPDGELFLPIRQAAGRFSRMLEEAGIETRLVFLSREELDAPPAVRCLEKGLFALRPQAYREKQENVFLFSGLSPYEEATAATRQILRLLSRGMDVERVAVLYPEGGDYAFAVAAALRDSGVPFYTDEKLAAVAHGLPRYLLCALRAAAGGWQNRDVLGMVKSGYSPLSFEEGCELENYVFTCGVNRNRWIQPFQRGEEALRERCEEYRKRLIDPVRRMREGLVAARNAAASMTAVFGLLQETGAYERLGEEEEKLLEKGLTVRAGQNSQVWQAVLGLMDQMVRLSDRQRIPLKHIASRMECGFSAVSLSALPPAGNLLHAGVLGHSLAENMDAVFILGLNDGVLGRETQSLLNPEERRDAEEKTGCFLGMTDESRALFAKLDLKRAMTLPRKLLFLSWAKTGVDGTALRRLNVLETVEKQMLPDPPQSPAPEDTLPSSAVQALGELSVELRAYLDGVGGSELSPGQKEKLKKLLESRQTAPAALRLLRALRYDGSARPVDPETARALYGGETLSVSRLEQFAGCPFQHFLTYGLRPQVLREWKVDPIETGTFYHAALDGFARLARREKDYPRVSPERVREMAEEAVAPLYGQAMSGPMGDGDRSLRRFEEAKGAVRRAAEAITRHLAAGSFRLAQTEAAFGYEGGLPPIVLQLPNGREIMLRGRIDRIDRYDGEDGVYLRVIDYKSSQQTLDAAKTWYGLQLQLLLYLDVCTSAVPGAKPAGAFYFYVADPLVESATDAAEAVEGEMRRLFRLRGVTLCDVEILEATDRGEEPCVIPPVYQKNGELRKDARALTLPQMTALMEHARETAARLAGEMMDGQTSISPVREGGVAACARCDHQSVCHFDPDDRNASFRELPVTTMEELREMLEE